MLASYTWSHSIDDASAGSIGEGSNALVPGINANLNRGPSDFDIRDAFSAGVTYEIPGPKINGFTNALLRGWSTENFIVARSAPPVNVYNGSLGLILNASAAVRPDLIPESPFTCSGRNIQEEKPSTTLRVQ